MSHDSNEAILSLVDDKPYLQFFGVGRTNHVKKLNNVLAKATDAIRGTMINSPFYAGDYNPISEHNDAKLTFRPSIQQQ